MDGGVRSIRPPHPPNPQPPPCPQHSPAPSRSTKTNDWSSLATKCPAEAHEKRKKERKNHKSERLAHTGGVLPFFSAASFVHLLHNIVAPFVLQLFTVRLMEATSLTVFSATPAAEQEEENGREKREQVDVIQNFNEAEGRKKNQQKKLHSYSLFTSWPVWSLLVPSREAGPADSWFSRSCSLLTLHSLIAKPTSLLQPS